MWFRSQRNRPVTSAWVSWIKLEFPEFVEEPTWSFSFEWMKRCRSYESNALHLVFMKIPSSVRYLLSICLPPVRVTKEHSCDMKALESLEFADPWAHTNGSIAGLQPEFSVLIVIFPYLISTSFLPHSLFVCLRIFIEINSRRVPQTHLSIFCHFRTLAHHHCRRWTLRRWFLKEKLFSNSL